MMAEVSDLRCLDVQLPYRRRGSASRVLRAEQQITGRGGSKQASGQEEARCPLTKASKLSILRPKRFGCLPRVDEMMWQTSDLECPPQTD